MGYPQRLILRRLLYDSDIQDSQENCIIVSFCQIKSKSPLEDYILGN